MTNTLHHGDALDILRTLPDNSVDSIVTDPPAGIAFMGKSWDAFDGKQYPDGADRKARDESEGKFLEGRGTLPYACSPSTPTTPKARDAFIAFMTDIMREALRVVKPGGHAFVWALPRTSHWTALALEEAGWQVREKVYHLFGSGFPKSSRISRDPRFCQCASSSGASARSGVGTDHETDVDDRTSTAALSASHSADVHSPNAQSGLQTPLGFQGDCQHDHDSNGGQPHQAQASVLASVPSQRCVPTHSHSDERADGQGGESSHSPSPARRNGHLSSQGYSHHVDEQKTPVAYSPSSNTRRRKTGLDSALRVDHTLYTDDLLSASQSPPQGYFSTGFPRCLECGKPNADGYGTATKPAAEEWILCRKPLSEPNVAANVLRWGTGAVNVDACRVGTDWANDPSKRGFGYDWIGSKDEQQRHIDNSNVYGEFTPRERPWQPTQGRWPPNVLLSHLPDLPCTCDGGDCAQCGGTGIVAGCREVGTKRVRGNGKPSGTYGTYEQNGVNAVYGKGLNSAVPNRPPYADADGREAVADWRCVEGCPVALLDAQSGPKVGAHGGGVNRHLRNRQSAFHMTAGEAVADGGIGAARFFPQFQPDAPFVPFKYQSKASRAERNRGCEGLPEVEARRHGDTGPSANAKPNGQTALREGNHHPCVKPLALLKWLITLITPPGGVVLDCFAGSGSMVVAATELGFDCIAIEKELEYFTILQARALDAELRSEAAQMIPLEPRIHTASKGQTNVYIHANDRKVLVCPVCDRRWHSAAKACGKCGGSLEWRNEHDERERRGEVGGDVLVTMPLFDTTASDSGD